MMEAMKTEYLLRLDEQDAFALKKVLGGLNDDEFSKLGVQGDDRRRMADILNFLPFDEDE